MMTFWVADFQFHGSRFKRFTFPPGTIASDNVVLANACEVNGEGFPQTGNAKITINQIVNEPDAVQIWLDVDWDSDLHIRVRFLVE
jgi:hypothetical protein